MCLFSQAVNSRLDNWAAALRPQRWERDRHQRRQQEAVVDMSHQQRFLEVRFALMHMEKMF